MDKSVKNNLKDFIIKNKLGITVLVVLLIILGITVYITFAFYTDSDTTNLISGSVGYFENPDLGINFMVEDRDVYGDGTNTYTSFWVAPSTGYTYNSSTSYCTNGATFTKSDDDTFTIESDGKTKCYFYYDAIDLESDADVKIIVMRDSGTEEGFIVASDYSMQGLYNLGLGYNSELSSCTNGANISYDAILKEINVASSETTVCTVYFDEENFVEIFTFSESILINNGNGATTVNDAISYIENRESSTLSTTSKTNEGLFSAEDNYGTSYYFRGAVDDNWVYFAGYYWRIIRVNGDGSVRMIYSGSTAPTSSQSVTMTGSSTYVDVGAYNTTTTNAVYAGYMYTTGTRSGSGTSSNAKKIIDAWYEENLLDTVYEDYIADSLFCVDRNSYTDTSGISVGTGYGTTTQYFASYIRNFTNTTPTLTCSNVLDSYTVDDTENGNGYLSYPIATITADEATFAGSVSSATNTSSYLYTGNIIYTMTPYSYSSGAYVMILNANAKIVGKIVNTSTYYYRPVISIEGDVIVEGTGTYNDPYVIVELN